MGAYNQSGLNYNTSSVTYNGFGVALTVTGFIPAGGSSNGASVVWGSGYGNFGGGVRMGTDESVMTEDMLVYEMGEALAEIQAIDQPKPLDKAEAKKIDNMRRFIMRHNVNKEKDFKKAEIDFVAMMADLEAVIALREEYDRLLYYKRASAILLLT